MTSPWAEEIEADLKWRESELVSLKAICVKYPEGSDTQRALLRAMWALMYAHYEGFHKFCWDLALDRIERERLSRSAASEKISKLSLSAVFRRFRGDTSPDGIWNFVFSQLPAHMVENISFSEKLETQSNLWPNVAQENNEKLDISCQYLDTLATKLKLIVERRNGIAHGKKLIVAKISEYQEYENAALLVMHELALAVIDLLDRRSYLLYPALPPPVSSAAPAA